MLGFTLGEAHVDFEVKMEKVHVESFTPNVIEPSFGIDRILYALLEHAYNVRVEEGAEAVPEEPAKGKKKGKGKSEQMEKMKRHVLEFKPDIAPFKVAVLPLQMTVNRDARYPALYESLVSSFTACGIDSRTDDTGVAIGKKYARHDELGIPFAVTVDGDSFKDGTVTLRERDSCSQVRMPLGNVAAEVSKLTQNNTKWEAIRAIYPNVTNEAEAKVGSSSKAPPSAAPAAVAKDVAGDVESYITQHNLRGIIQEAVSSVVSARSEVPIASLVAALQKHL